MKAWDVTAPAAHAFIRDVLVVSGGVSAGAFSADCSQLIIGDATGKVHLLSIDDSDIIEPGNSQATTSISVRPNIKGQAASLHQRSAILPSGLKRPKVIIPHPEPPPPKNHHRSSNPSFTAQEQSIQTGPETSRQLISSGMIRVHPDPWIGAIQGRNYTETNLFRYEAHLNQDSSASLLPEWATKQRQQLYTPQPSRLEIAILPQQVLFKQKRDIVNHQRNIALDLDIAGLSLETKNFSRREKWEVEWDGLGLEEEASPGEEFEIFREDRSSAAKKAREFWEEMKVNFPQQT